MKARGEPVAQGIVLRGPAAAARAGYRAALERLGVAELAAWSEAMEGADAQGPWLALQLREGRLPRMAQPHDTLVLAGLLGLSPESHASDLVREVVLALLMGPQAHEFPSGEELESAVRIRCNIVQAARRTTLTFDTEAVQRPQDCWDYDEDTGFTLRPGVPLIEALVKTTQPEVSGQCYAFSCYRATEYVILLGLAQELARSNPPLLARLQEQWGRRAIMSGEFHDTFLREQGSMAQPLPARYFVPGDRVWFRNPHEASADASGFEGSWVMYLGSGLFSNFWQRAQPYTLVGKCVEIYHWRHGLYRDAQGEARIDEARIAPLIAATLAEPRELAHVLARMTRYREPRGIYTEAGGCIDTTRECVRWVHPATADLVLPAD